MTVQFDTFCTAKCRASIDIPEGVDDVLKYIREHLDDASVQDIWYYGDLEEPTEYERE